MKAIARPLVSCDSQVCMCVWLCVFPPFYIATHPINTPYQYTPSIHSINTPYQYTPSIHPINTPYQYTLSIHPINTLYQYTLSPYLYHHTCTTTSIAPQLDQCNLEHPLPPLYTPLYYRSLTSHTLIDQKRSAKNSG